MKSVLVVSHPLIEHSMTVLRDKQTRADEFRRHADIVAKLLLIEAAKDLTTGKLTIDTPLAPFDGQSLKSRVIVVPILRAGISMLSAAYELLPSIAVGFVGLVRDEKTAIADKYYEKIPKINSDDNIFVVDPMLATGGSMDEALNIVKAGGAKKITVVTIVCAPEGLERVAKNHPDVPIITAAVDEKLDSKAYIVPGLGDFGDRYFGTE
ncbi:TPA: uracil phosphoribosyltransferase [Candidatus Saccharibacteria bacterium]|nr:MAG: Uracil phosphoribosyltransferase [Candidatus Saccharibacteria bacterium GW2011_GWA2_46_10]OGL35789.1 MAG: uracil phosphoribosyltransferase [Candidatus Saccharibacteria bacterium RIFCSPHIGHO2_12_FULL_47_17]HCM51594.1 uracil phosphoribosyltransferase [Candidatus Saccharibacteria bacterium]